MTDEENQTQAVEDEDKLDLAAVAEQLAAKSREVQGDTAIQAEPQLPEEAAESDEPGEAEAVQAALASDGDESAEGPELAEGEHELSGAEVYAAVEALLFAADKPVTPAQMARALPRGINAREVRTQLKAIREELAEGERGFELMEIAGGWQLFTREKFAVYVAKLKKTAGGRKLSGSALETLAVVAYKQPVTRAEVERIRGVACGDMLRNLMEKRLVKITGRSPELGNPLLYGTTADFLNHFALGSLSELPRSAELGRKPQPKAPAVSQAEEGEEKSEGGQPPETADTDSDTDVVDELEVKSSDSDTDTDSDTEGETETDTDIDSEADGEIRE
jgi:segregation and condensation protein B